MCYFWINHQKSFWKLLIAWKSDQEGLANNFTNHHSAKHHKRVHPIYIHTCKTSQSFPVVLLKISYQECDHPADFMKEDSRNKFPILGLSGLRGSKVRTKDSRTMGI